MLYGISWTVITLWLFGGLGQAFRVLQGLKKAIKAGKDIEVGRVIATLITGMITGGLVGMIAKDWRMAFMAGYTGTDFIEGLVKH